MPFDPPGGKHAAAVDPFNGEELIELPPHLIAACKALGRYYKDLISRLGGNQNFKSFTALRTEFWAAARYHVGMTDEEFSKLTHEQLFALLNLIARRQSPSRKMRPPRKLGRGLSAPVDGESLKAFRRDAGLTQPELAELADVDNSTVQRGERGERLCSDMRDKIAKALSHALGLTITAQTITSLQ